MATSSQRLIGAVLIAAGAAFLVAGLALGTAVDPIWASLIAVGGCDIIFGAMFMTGRIGGMVDRDADPAESRESTVDPSAQDAGNAREVPADEPDPRAGTDPDYNPYVRDD